MTRSIPEYCREKTLIIPQSLHDMADASSVMAHNGAAIFYKCIRQDLRDIEFYTTSPCLAFVISGDETFTSHSHQQTELAANEMLFMAKNVYMISDFVRRDGPLEAFLFFFDRGVIDEYLRSAPMAAPVVSLDPEPFKIAASEAIRSYMQALQDVYRSIRGTPDLLRIKLLELLFLLDALGDRERLRAFLTAAHANGEKRNVRHLMREHCYRNMSVRDYAMLSGRSVASFTREFKRQFGTTPRQWLIDIRLERAMELATSTKMSVTEISLEIGYENISHFIKAFKARFGKTPKQVQSALIC